MARFIGLSMLIFVYAAVLWQEEAYCDKTFNAVSCKSKNKFSYMHNTFDCFENGHNRCNYLGLFLLEKLKCYRCCQTASRTPLLNKTRPSIEEPSSTTVSTLPREDAQSDKKDSENLITPIAISACAALLLFIAVVVLTFKYAEWLRRFRHGDRGQHEMDAIMSVADNTAQDDTTNDVTTKPVQEISRMIRTTEV